MGEPRGIGENMPQHDFHIPAHAYKLYCKIIDISYYSRFTVPGWVVRLFTFGFAALATDGISQVQTVAKYEVEQVTPSRHQRVCARHRAHRPGAQILTLLRTAPMSQTQCNAHRAGAPATHDGDRRSRALKPSCLTRTLCGPRLRLLRPTPLTLSDLGPRFK